VQRTDDVSSPTITPTTPISELPELLTPREFFSFARIGKTCGYGLIATGRIKVVRLGRQIRIPRDELAKVG
jgi:excisionase family DNA binding protein